MNNIIKANQTSDILWTKIDELTHLEQREEIIRNWVNSSEISFTDDKKNEITLKSIYGNYIMDNGKAPSVEEIVKILSQFAAKKEEFKTKKKDQQKSLAVNGGALNVYSGQAIELKIQSQILANKINQHDRDLFNCFRQCGDSIVIVDEGETLLCVEDAKGAVKIPQKYFLKGNIAERVRWKFTQKFCTYLNNLNKWLVDLEEYVYDAEDENCSISPIEDYIETECPTLLRKIVKIYNYPETIHTGKNTSITKPHYRASIIDKIGDVDDVFGYILNHWPEYNKAIFGQDKFIAWSNDRTITSSSYWDLPKENVQCPEPWLNFMKQKMNGHLMRRFIYYWGAVCDANNHSQQYLIISDKGGTGKDFSFRCLTSVLPKNCVSDLTTNMLDNDDRFGLAGIEVWKSHLSIIHEVNNSNNLMSEKAKQFFGQNTMDLEVKNAGVVKWHPINHKTIVFSNKKMSIKDFANRRRAIPITFNNKLDWSEELENSMKNTAKQFLDFCYMMYKNEPMVKNGQYLVLNEEDEQAYLKGELNIGKDNYDYLSKKAFSEECLKDYYNSDNYEENELAIDIFEPVTNDLLEITNNPEDKLSASDFLEKLKVWIIFNSGYAHDFQCSVVNSEIRNFSYHNSCVWKLYKYLEEKYNIKKKAIRIDGKNVQGFSGVKLKEYTGIENTNPCAESFQKKLIIGDETMNNILF